MVASPLQFPLTVIASATTTVTTILWLLGVVSLVAVVTRFIRVPYTIGLVVAGLILGISGGFVRVPLTEGMILEVFLPALLFEAAYHLPWARLRAEIRTITALAIPGVVASTFVVGAIVHLAGLRWPVALLFGALISATDPVSVLATFRQLGTDRRLAIIVEGESLFNDGTALVVFRLVLSITIAGGVSAAATGFAFVLSIAGGILAGLAVGYLGALALRQIDDYLIEITATLLMAYGTFILAEHLTVTRAGVELGASPVIAVVVLGLVTGNYASRQSMSAQTRISMNSTWELVGYLANSLIFLIIGLQVQEHPFHRGDVPHVLAALVGVLVSRALIVYGVSGYMNLRLPRARRIPLSFQHVINWGGLRGAVALAAALSIPVAAVPERPAILLMTFSVVLFTLLVEGLTIRPLVAALGLGGRGHSPNLAKFERLRAQIAAAQAARNAIADPATAADVGRDVQEGLLATYDERAAQLRAALDGLRVSDDELRAERMEIAQRRALQAEKDALLALRNRGALTGGVYRSLAADVDARLLHLEALDEPIPATAADPETRIGGTLSPVPVREDEAG
jgi:CPA1 family monovalent cation:H+ antiporter